MSPNPLQAGPQWTAASREARPRPGRASMASGVLARVQLWPPRASQPHTFSRSVVLKFDYCRLIHTYLVSYVSIAFSFNF